MIKITEVMRKGGGGGCEGANPTPLEAKRAKAELLRRRFVGVALGEDGLTGARVRMLAKSPNYT